MRHLATTSPVRGARARPGQPARRPVVSEELTTELRERVELAGVEVLESRITHLAYAPEIAQAMLARQQANAIVAARSKIVEGAVGMVSNALERLRERERRRTRRGAQGPDGGQPAGRALRRPGDPAGRERRHAVLSWTMAERKKLLLRLDPEVLRRGRPVGRRRSAQRQRPDRVRPAAGAAGGQPAARPRRPTTAARGATRKTMPATARRLTRARVAPAATPGGTMPRGGSIRGRRR